MFCFMTEIDDMIYTAIARLADSGVDTSVFFVDLYRYQKRITKKLKEEYRNTCNNRGVKTIINENNVQVVIDLNLCHFSVDQAARYRQALQRIYDEGYRD